MIFAFPALWLYLGLSSLSSYKQHGHEYLVKYIYMIFSRFLITAVSRAWPCLGLLSLIWLVFEERHHLKLFLELSVKEFFKSFSILNFTIIHFFFSDVKIFITIKLTPASLPLYRVDVSQSPTPKVI